MVTIALYDILYTSFSLFKRRELALRRTYYSVNIKLGRAIRLLVVFTEVFCVPGSRNLGAIEPLQAVCSGADLLLNLIRPFPIRAQNPYSWILSSREDPPQDQIAGFKLTALDS